MKTCLTLFLTAALLSPSVFAADGKSALEIAEKRYADDRKLCADEPDSARRMQCLRDAKAEYDKAVGATAAVPQASAAAPSCAGCGKVSSVRVSERSGEGSTASMVAGGVVGALLGNQIGKGTTRDVATVAGAAGGAYAGKKIEESVKKVKHWDVAVRFDSGDEKVFGFDKDPGFVTGSLVKTSGNSIVAR